MKPSILCAVFIAASTTLCFGQSIQPAPQMPADNNKITQRGFPDLSDPGAAQKLMAEIMNVLGLQPNFIMKVAKVSNVEASISHRKRYILYNPGFINQINTITRDQWTSTALLAHEIGHHLNGHTLGKAGSNPQLELEADEFAGFVLAKLGASLEQSQLVFKYISKVNSSKTHPGRMDRMIAIEKGWNKATGNHGGLAETAKGNTPVLPQTATGN
jgi:hypothetical protein